MPLYLDTGHSSSRGADRSEKSCLIVVPNTEHQAAHGALLAIADGLPEHPNPEGATHDTLKALGQAFYATPENWSLGHALRESAFAANKALLADSFDPGRASALSSLVLRGRRWAIAHAGHTRVWLVRDSKVKVLTRDHVEPRLQRAPRVTRACGLAPDLDTEFVSGELRENDVFILTTAGIHNALTGAQLLACVMLDMTAAQMASMVTGKVDSAGSTGSSVCVVRVEQLPAESQADIEEDITALPAVTPPDIGSEIDGFRIERLAHKSSRYRLYKAIDIPSGQIVALKFPNPRDAENNPGFAEVFLREEWIGRRVSSAHLVRTLALKKGRRTVLYSVMAYPRGESLAKALARKGTLGVRASIFTGTQLLDALGELHHQGIIHHDVRPQNIVIDKRSKNLMLLGLGGHMTRTTSGTETSSGSRRGSFLAPELFEHDIEPTVRADIFAAGVTIYRMLSGTYPYGKILRNGQAPCGEYVPVTTYCAEASPELDDALRRACALDPNERFESAHEFVHALEQSAAQSNVSHMRPKSGKASPRMNWELALVGALLLALLAYIVLSF